MVQHIHQISSLIWPETQLISVQSSRLLLFRVEMNLVLLKHKRCNHQISLLTPLQKRMAMIMLIIRMAPYDVFWIQAVIQSSETCFVGLDLKVERNLGGVEPWWNSDDTANASERQLDGKF